MENIVNFVKKHFLLILVVILVGYIFLNNQNKSIFYSSLNSDYSNYSRLSPQLSVGSMAEPEYKGMVPQSRESVDVGVAAPDRKKIENIELNITVKSVNQTIKILEAKVVSLQGFVVNSYYSKPNEAESGYVTVRIPTNTKQQFLDFVKETSINIVSETANGDDVTDQYTNIEERLKILNANKARFEEIMNSAVEVSDILNVQREVFNLQSQIDSLVGQKQYIEKVSTTTRYMINLSTDEYAFSYLPKDGWNPQAIFKEAVRSLVLTVRGLGTKAIWILVYSLIWLPFMVVGFIVYKKFWRSKKI